MSVPVGLRALLLLVVVALLGAVPAPAGAAASPTCGAGQAPVLVAAKHGAETRKTACRTLAPAKGASLGPALASARGVVPTAARLRAAAPKRLRSRLPLKDLAKLQRALTARASRYAVRTAQDCGAAGESSGPERTTQDGVTVTGTATRWGALDGPTHGTGRDTTVKLADGSSKREQDRSCVSWDSCPNADGDVPGHFDASYRQTMHAEKDGVSLDLTVTIEVEAELIAHVGPDARLTTFDWTATGTGGLRAVLRNQGKVIKYLPDSNVRLSLHGTGADPRARGASPAQPELKVWASKASLLDGANAEMMNVARALANYAYAVPGDSSDELLQSEKVFYDQAACLDVVFDPAVVDVQAGAQVPVAVSVNAKDGGAVASAYTVTPTIGTVADVHGSTPGTITYIAPSKFPVDGVYQDFTLEALSKRGRALSTHRARPVTDVTYWDVTFAGTAGYQRHEGPQMQAQHDVSGSFSWSTTWHAVPVGAERPAPWASVASTVTGTWEDAGRFGAPGPGDFDCTGALGGEGDSAFAEVVKGSSPRLRLWPFASVSSDASEPACSGLPGAPWAGVFLSGDQPALTALVGIDPTAPVGRPTTVAVTPGQTLAGDCSDYVTPTLSPCTHAVGWTGTVTLTRVAAPAS